MSPFCCTYPSLLRKNKLHCCIRALLTQWKVYVSVLVSFAFYAISIELEGQVGFINNTKSKFFIKSHLCCEHEKAREAN